MKTIIPSEKRGPVMKSLSLIPLSLLTLILVCMIALSMTSCNDLPPCSRPSVPVPSAFRSASEQVFKPDAGEVKEYLGDLFWWDFLQDDVLKDLVSEAIAHNYDVKLAAEKILEYQARVGMARASQFPTVSATGGLQTVHVSQVGPTPMTSGANPTTYSFTIGALANYETDFWGRLRYSTAAARANLLATEEAKNVTLMTLVSEVATNYLQLRELDLELELSKQTLQSRDESLKLVKAREEGGVVGMMDVNQALGLYLTAQTTVTQVEQQIAQKEDYISFLLGRNPGDIPRGKSLPDQFSGEPVPPGLPSSILTNRPDIRKAELLLLAANAQIGSARAAYFPDISLTGAAGTQSRELANLFSAPSYYWNMAGGLLQPLFNGGQIKSQVALTESQKRQYVISYQSTVQAAFRDVSDALISYQKSTTYSAQQKELTDCLKDQSRLAKMRYEGGVTNYLEVLDTENQLFSAELQYAKAQLNVYTNLVKLYNTLGGGWKQKPEASPSTRQAEVQKPGPSQSPGK